MSYSGAGRPMDMDRFGLSMCPTIGCATVSVMPNHPSVLMPKYESLGGSQNASPHRRKEFAGTSRSFSKLTQNVMIEHQVALCSTAVSQNRDKLKRGWSTTVQPAHRLGRTE